MTEPTWVNNLLYNMGITDRRVGSWCVTNFLWNTLKGDRNSRRYLIQRWLHDKLVPILNPKRLKKYRIVNGQPVEDKVT